MKSIEDMSVHELRNRKDEVVAEWAAVMARLKELEQIGEGAEPEAEPGAEPKPNAQPEGADAASGDAA